VATTVSRTVAKEKPRAMRRERAFRSSFVLRGYEVRAVHDQGSQGEQPDQDRVPVEDSGGARERAEVCPQRLEEVAAFVQGDAAHHVTEGGAVEDREERAADEERRVPERGPHRVVYVPAQLDGEAPDHQEPEHDDQGQVEPGEAGGV